MEKKDAVVTEMIFGNVTIKRLPEDVANNEDLYNEIDKLIEEGEGDKIPEIIEILRNAGATYFIIFTGNEHTTKYQYEVHSAVIIKMKEMLTWVEC